MLMPTQADGDHASLAKSRHQLELVHGAGAAQHAQSLKEGSWGSFSSLSLVLENGLSLCASEVLGWFPM